MEIRIVEVPPGEAPEHIRRAWVGLVLPLAAGESGRRQEARATGPFGRLRQWLEGRRWHYVVPADAALNILKQAAPEAAAWWRANAPERIAPDQTFEFPPAVCEKMVRLAVGSRDVLVGTRPLEVGWVLGFRSMRLRRVSDERLVLRPTGVLLLFALGPLLFGIVFLVMGIEPALVGHPPWQDFLGLCLGVVPVLAFGVGCLVPARTYVFDRAAGVLRVSRLGLFSRRERPLREVAAVQLVRRSTSGPRRSRPRTTYQLNLVLLDGRPDRMCLSNDNDWEATRAAAAELAGFLAVPFLDEVSATGPGGTDGGAESGRTGRCT
jgi:hypothetical protein